MMPPKKLILGKHSHRCYSTRGKGRVRWKSSNCINCCVGCGFCGSYVALLSSSYAPAVSVLWERPPLLLLLGHVDWYGLRLPEFRCNGPCWSFTHKKNEQNILIHAPFLLASFPTRDTPPAVPAEHVARLRPDGRTAGQPGAGQVRTRHTHEEVPDDVHAQRERTGRAAELYQPARADTGDGTPDIGPARPEAVRDVLPVADRQQRLDDDGPMAGGNDELGRLPGGTGSAQILFAAQAERLPLERAGHPCVPVAEHVPEGGKMRGMGEGLFLSVSEQWKLIDGCHLQVTLHHDDDSEVQINSVLDEETEWFHPRVKCFPVYTLMLAVNRTSIDLLSLGCHGQELQVSERVYARACKLDGLMAIVRFTCWPFVMSLGFYWFLAR